MKYKSFVVLCCIALIGCVRKKVEQSAHEISPSKTVLRYADGFRVIYHDNVKEVEVKYPFQGATVGYKYLLVQRGQAIPEHNASTHVITIPLNTIVCTSTTHIPLLDYLDESDKLIGFPSTDLISSEKIRHRIAEGKVQDLGMDKSMNLEKLLVLKPGMMMGYTISSDMGQFKKVEELGVPVVINSEYLEKHPLGRAEWIKFMALFFNKEREADSVFNVIEHQYMDVKAQVSRAESKPTVLSGVLYGDAWFLPGGDNYASRILKDANCLYMWKDDPSSGYLQLGFEAVYEKAHNADLWIGVGTYSTLEEIKNADSRYTRFKPFAKKSVYTYNARKGAKGGSEFMELGYLRPDIILKDLVKIAHPEVLPEYELYFHKKLE